MHCDLNNQAQSFDTTASVLPLIPWLSVWCSCQPFPLGFQGKSFTTLPLTGASFDPHTS